MYYIPQVHDTPPMRALFLWFWLVGIFAVVPVVSWCLVQFLAVTGLIAKGPRLFAEGAFEHVGTWVWLGLWQVGNVLWVLLAYLLDARSAHRDASRRLGAGGAPVILRWRNRLLVGGAPSRLRRFAWFSLGPGNRILVYPVLVAVCAFVAHASASIEKQPNSVGPQPVAAAVFAGLALIFAAMTVHRFRRRAQLLRNAGMLACTVTYSGEEGSLWRIDYRYRTAAGTEQTGSEHLDFRPSRVPAPGDRLAILATETDVQVM